ncbi:MAG: CRISPR-associated helicase Cas3' [Nannocystaceae bacterium]
MNMSFQSFFEAATGHPPFPFQCEFATAEQLPQLLRAPTGSGKTATAIIGWLWRRHHASDAVRRGTPRRLVFCLPMRTLVQQTETVATQWIKALGLDVPVHSLLGGAIDNRWESEPDKDLLLIGTQDQLLSRALNRGFAMSRFKWPVHFALLNNDALWVMDEVQLMGVGLSTSAQLDAFRHRLGCFGVAHTVWMSATLDERLLDTVDTRDAGTRRRLELSEADYATPQLGKRWLAQKACKKLDDIFDKKTPAYARRLAEIVGELHEPGERTIVVMNRVDRAQDLTRQLKKSGIPTTLLHSRFRPLDRTRAMDTALAPDYGGVLVATQVIEAGVDITSKLLVTEICPWSSFVQRVGRCNRTGSQPGSRVFWIDIPDSEASPYSDEELQHARALLADLVDAGPSKLPLGTPDQARPASPVLRRSDLVDLFDTTPDLTGCDIDVGQYIRNSDDLDVQVAWRDWEAAPKSGPPNDMPALHRDELVRVSISQFSKFIKKERPGFRWDSLDGSWERVVRSVPPGSTVLLAGRTGGYDAELGWVRESKKPVTPVEFEALSQDSDDAERLTYGSSKFVTLQQHSTEARDEMNALRCPAEWEIPLHTLVRAAHWHDVGKAHQSFQDMLCASLTDGDPLLTQGPWAKSKRGSRTPDPRSTLSPPSTLSPRGTPRKNFRHEVASALAYLEHFPDDDLGAYVVMCHHGKVRTALRSRPKESGNPERRGQRQRFAHGVWEGDPLPAVNLGDGTLSEPITLNLDRMELGCIRGSWVTLSHGLLSHWGPFRLAMLESLVRVADWRASALHDEGVHDDA